MKLLAKRDPLYELTEQEKELLWKNRYGSTSVSYISRFPNGTMALSYRYFGAHAPECLPKLISAVRWQNRDEVAEVRDWP